MSLTILSFPNKLTRWAVLSLAWFVRLTIIFPISVYLILCQVNGRSCQACLALVVVRCVRLSSYASLYRPRISHYCITLLSDSRLFWEAQVTSSGSDSYPVFAKVAQRITWLAKGDKKVYWYNYLVTPVTYAGSPRSKFHLDIF